MVYQAIFRLSKAANIFFIIAIILKQVLRTYFIKNYANAG